MPTKILICDDEDVLRALIRATLDGERYELVEARDGEESLELAQEVKPDVILLDMMMPGKSGLEVLAELRRDPDLRRIPVVMLTARTQESDRDAAVDAGAERYLAKPFSPARLAAVVADVVENSP